MKHCSMMSRMKENYENRNKHYLVRRTPVIIRLDGKAFHTYTQGLNKPFDVGLIEDMQTTAWSLCKLIQNAKCAYVQSDEISLLLTDYDTLETQAWFDYEVQKLTSVSASFATAEFNRLRLLRSAMNKVSVDADTGRWLGNLVWWNQIRDFNLAHFDSRCFNIPREEVANYFLARQKDAIKNSISALAQSLYSHKELQNKNSKQQQELCFQKGHNWNNLPYAQKLGTWIKRDESNNWVYYQPPFNFSENDFKEWC